MKHFSNKDLYQYTGVIVETPSGISINDAKDLSHINLYNKLSEFGKNCHLKLEIDPVSQTFKLTVRVPEFKVTLDKKSLPESKLSILTGFERDITLAYAEEWVHAYQHLLVKPVSKNAPLLMPQVQRWDRNKLMQIIELDLAQFFHEQGIPLSITFMGNHEGRREALNNLK